MKVQSFGSNVVSFISSSKPNAKCNINILLANRLQHCSAKPTGIHEGSGYDCSICAVNCAFELHTARTVQLGADQL